MVETLPAIATHYVATSRLKTRVLFAGPSGGIPVLFIHGNLSSATWWEETMLRLPPRFRAIAPDLRGYGGAEEGALIDATRGLEDFVDDLAALLAELGVEKAHCVGHSLGGGVLWRFLGRHAERVLSLTQVCPASPFGFGGCRGDGTPCFPDNAGAGAGGVNPQFARLMALRDRTDKSPFHPRAILNAYVWSPPFVPPRMEAILSASLSQHCGPKAYPGDAKPSPNWPGAAPGRHGPINALAPLYQHDPLAFIRLAHKPRIMWIRGEADKIVSDLSLFDLGALGSLGAVPGWPGMDVYPPQPMIGQISKALDMYEQSGGRVRRVVLAGIGHSPYLEAPKTFDEAFHAHLDEK